MFPRLSWQGGTCSVSVHCSPPCGSLQSAVPLCRVPVDFHHSVGTGYLLVLCLIFNSLLDTSLRQKQEQQMTGLRGDCQENNEIQQSYTCGDYTVCDSRCYVQLQPIKGKLQDMIPRNGFISSIPLYTKITK